MDLEATVVCVAVGVLGATFVGALVLLVVICRRHGDNEGYMRQMTDARSDNPMANCEVELEVRLHPNIEQILTNEQWVDDATGLVPHCLAVLKICHTLTEKLAAITMDPLSHSKAGHDIIQVAQRISPRVDDVVRSMYPPLDARLLEARTSVLALSVTQLVLISRHGCRQGQTANMQWIEHALADMDIHLMILRDAAILHEASCHITNMIKPNANTLNHRGQKDGTEG